MSITFKKRQKEMKRQAKKSGVAGSGVSKPKIGSPGGQLRISFKVRSATPGASLSMPKIKDVIAKTLRRASRSSATAYSAGLLQPFFTSARLVGSIDSIPMQAVAARDQRGLLSIDFAGRR